MIERKNPILIITLILVGFFVYAFNLNDLLFWDDDAWIKGNVFVHSFSYLKEIFTQNVEAGFGLSSNYYRPLLLLSFAFNYVFGAENPFGYHLLSNGFHIANGILIFILLTKFLSSRASFIASILFLIHPAQTEAVTYISGRGDPMSVFFMLLAIWFFIKSLDIEIFKSRVYRVFSLVSMVLALLSRETAVLFPALLMIFYISFLTKEKFTPALKKSFVLSLPFWAVSIVYFFLRLTVFNFQNTLNFFSQPTPYSENLSFRLFTFGSALVEYFKILFVPVGLHMERSLLVNTSFFQWPVYLATIIVAAILLIIIYSHRLKIKEQNSDFGILFFGWAWFFAALAPVSGIIPINAIIYEHWLYLPIIGFVALAGFYSDKLLSFLKSKNLIVSYKLLLVGLIIYFSFFAIQSIKRNILWGNTVEFYEDILRYSPSSVRTLTNLGNIYSEKGDLVKAGELFERAIENPDADIFAQPHYNLGNLYRDTGRVDEAIGEYKKAIEVDPNFPFAYQNLAEIYVNRKQDLVSGIRILEELKEIQPGNPRVYYNLGLLYLATDNIDLAVDNFETGLKLVSGRDLEVEKATLEILDRIR